MIKRLLIIDNGYIVDVVSTNDRKSYIKSMKIDFDTIQEDNDNIFKKGDKFDVTLLPKNMIVSESSKYAVGPDILINTPFKKVVIGDTNDI